MASEVYILTDRFKRSPDKADQPSTNSTLASNTAEVLQFPTELAGNTAERMILKYCSLKKQILATSEIPLKNHLRDKLKLHMDTMTRKGLDLKGELVGAEADLNCFARRLSVPVEPDFLDCWHVRRISAEKALSSYQT